VTLTQTITDGDGSTASASLDLGAKLSITDDTPIISSIQNAIMAGVNNTDVQGTWQPTFGADGPSSSAAIGIAVPSGTINGTTYAVTDTHTTNAAGDEVFQVAVTGSSNYTFYEYTHYTAGTQSAEMYAYSTLADADGVLGNTNNEFFTLTMASSGTYDFHLTSTTALESVVTTNFASGGNSGEGIYAELANGGVTYVKSASTIPSTVPAGFDAIIDGWNATDPTAPDPLNHTVHADHLGFGLDNGNFQTNQVINFMFAQSEAAVDIGIGKGGNAATEHFLVTLLENGTVIATENITLPDSQTVLIDSADWAQNVNGQTVNSHTGTFGTFNQLEIENVASAASDDTKLNITTVTFNEQTIVGSTTLNFTPTITDGDGSVATGSNFSVNLNATANSNGGYTLTGGTGNDVILSSSHVDTMTGGSGSNTYEFNNPLDGGGQGSGVTISTSNTDQITNFHPATDSIEVSAAGFGGGLTFDEIFNSTQVQNSSTNSFTNSSERFLFDTTNQTLYYSPNGTTANEHAIAILNLVSAINPTNIHVTH
jgi:hypothetical protein